jgi:hypothetical protein
MTMGTNLRLDLRAGEWVEVRSREEILTTLDESGQFEDVPFMPEMLGYCGKRFRVIRRADKTCDNSGSGRLRRLTNSVFLEGIRCSGGAHDGCEAGCLIFWKEAWLKRPGDDSIPMSRPPLCSEDSLLAATQTSDRDGSSRYVCQATEVPRFTTPLKIWDLREYWRDLCSGNLNHRLHNGSLEQRILEVFFGVMLLTRALVLVVFNEIQHRRGRPRYPFFRGQLTRRTPASNLDLQPGELVQARSPAEIIATLDRNNCNRGMPFCAEMLPYCGGIYRVVRRVRRIVDERNGRMLHLANPCIILEGVVCKGTDRRLCPRANYLYWRECWLTRAGATCEAAPPCSNADAARHCERGIATNHLSHDDIQEVAP